MAATAWDMVHPPSKSTSSTSKKVEEGGFSGMTDIPLSRTQTTASISPLLPPGVNQKLGERFAGLKEGIGAFGFGKQQQQQKQGGGGGGVKISRPLETLPRESGPLINGVKYIDDSRLYLSSTAGFHFGRYLA